MARRKSTRKPRDPRVDPRPGDVLEATMSWLVAPLRWTVVGRRPGFVEWNDSDGYGQEVRFGIDWSHGPFDNLPPYQPEEDAA